MPHPISQDEIDKGLRYAMALGVVRRVSSQPTKGRDGLAYRRFTVYLSDGSTTTWGPREVLAFAVGVRLATDRVNP